MMYTNSSNAVYDISIELNNQASDIVILETPLETFVRDLIYLLAVNKNELPNLRKVGTDLEKFLQDNITPNLISQIETTVAEDILNFLGVQANVKANMSKDTKTIKLNVTISLPEKRELILSILVDKFKNAVQITDVKLQQNRIVYKVTTE